MKKSCVERKKITPVRSLRYSWEILRAIFAFATVRRIVLTCKPFHRKPSSVVTLETNNENSGSPMVGAFR